MIDLKTCPTCCSMRIRRDWLTAAGCVNTWPKDKLHKWLNAKR